MNELREDLHAALDDQMFSGDALWSRVISELDLQRRKPRHGWEPVVAAGLAVALVATLLIVRTARDGGSPVLHRSGTTNACLQPSTTKGARVGEITEYPAPPDLGLTADITDGAGCSLWFVGNANVIVKVSTAGAFTEYPIPGAFTTVRSITAGRGSDIWFTESRNNFGQAATGTRLINAGVVATLSASGTYTEYAIPAADSSVLGITIGPDSNVWGTDYGANEVFKMTSAGRFTAYTIPTPNSQAAVITTGPDGNLWFTETNARKLARITTSGVITEFALPDPDFFPVSVAAGAGGNLWITERSRFGAGGPGKVARVTTSGAFTEYQLPPEMLGGNSHPFEEPGPGPITAGPDGNLWLTQGANIDRVTPSGVISQYLVGAYLTGIAVGPDGNIWFTGRDLAVQSSAIVGKLVALPAA